jgi:hypothetical protein
MPKSEFAIPSEKGKQNQAGKGAYPIPDASHARNALARVAQHGTPAEKKEVRAAVHRKYPSIGEGESGLHKAMSAHADKVHPTGKS